MEHGSIDGVWSEQYARDSRWLNSPQNGMITDQELAIPSIVIVLVEA